MTESPKLPELPEIDHVETVKDMVVTVTLGGRIVSVNPCNDEGIASARVPSKDETSSALALERATIENIAIAAQIRAPELRIPLVTKLVQQLQDDVTRVLSGKGGSAPRRLKNPDLVNQIDGAPGAFTTKARRLLRTRAYRHRLKKPWKSMTEGERHRAVESLRDCYKGRKKITGEAVHPESMAPPD